MDGRQGARRLPLGVQGLRQWAECRGAGRRVTNADAVSRNSVFRRDHAIPAHPAPAVSEITDHGEQFRGAGFRLSNGLRTAVQGIAANGSAAQEKTAQNDWVVP